MDWTIISTPLFISWPPTIWVNKFNAALIHLFFRRIYFLSINSVISASKNLEYNRSNCRHRHPLSLMISRRINCYHCYHRFEVSLPAIRRATGVSFTSVNTLSLSSIGVRTAANKALSCCHYTLSCIKVRSEMVN